jgi:hypothetical protein
MDGATLPKVLFPGSSKILSIPEENQSISAAIYPHLDSADSYQESQYVDCDPDEEHGLSFDVANKGEEGSLTTKIPRSSSNGPQIGPLFGISRPFRDIHPPSPNQPRQIVIHLTRHLNVALHRLK